jgi:excisionase family DNA binding protein
MTTTANRLIPTREAAERLGIHAETLRRLVRDGQVQAVQLREGGWLRFREADLARLLGETPTAAQREARIAELEAKLAVEQRALALDRLATVEEPA